MDKALRRIEQKSRLKRVCREQFDDILLLELPEHMQRRLKQVAKDRNSHPEGIVFDLLAQQLSLCE